jgi:hypothetical protein
VKLRRAVLGLVLLGCRPAAEPDSAVSVTVPPGPSELGDDRPKPDPEPKLDLPGRSSSDGWTSTLASSPCELVCADVFSCSLIDHDPRAAATIELGCLDACVRAPKAFTSCERPRSIAADTCAAYLGCVRGAWPSEERPRTIIDAERDGCDIACKALARCRGFPEYLAEECASQCRQSLTPELQQFAVTCGDYESCPAVERCVNSLPGAR